MRLRGPAGSVNDAIALKRSVTENEVPRPSERAENMLESHKNERQYDTETIDRLQAEHARLQNRLDAMYVDKPDRRVSAAFFHQKADSRIGSPSWTRTSNPPVNSRVLYH
jgi:hypothetical protein